MALRRSLSRLHGRFTTVIGDRPLTVGEEVLPMVPSNNIYHDAPKLRARLDSDGFLYFKNLVPRDAVSAGYRDLARQLESNGWAPAAERAAEEATHGFANGVIAPRQLPPPPPTEGFGCSERVLQAICGTNVMAAVRQVFGGPVTLLNYHTLELSYPGEQHGFSMPAVHMNQGTKLLLNAWVPLHDIPLSVGGLAMVRGSNSSKAFETVRKTYGQHEVEAGDVSGDGCFTHSSDEILAYGDPIVTTGFEAGDLVLSTVYTMQTYARNSSRQWRVAGASRWIMEGDDVGADPRYVGAEPPGLSAWASQRDNRQRYPRTMAEAKAAWGLGPKAPVGGTK